MAILEIASLRKYFGEVRAVDDVTLNVPEGEIASLVGPNGAGKTTLINLITGLIRPDAGRIVFLGEEVAELSPQERIRRGMARSFQIVNLYDRLRVLDNIRIAVLSRSGKTHRLYSLLERDGEARKQAAEVLSLFGLHEKEGLPASGLSQGDRKLLDVAIAFALRPQLLLLDEPTSGVSTREKENIMKTIVSAMKKEKVTTIIVEHDMDVVFKYSDRVIVMHEGRILADGTPSDIRGNEQVQSTLLGVRPVGHPGA